MMLMTEQLSRMRVDDKLGLRRHHRQTKELPFDGLRPVSSGVGVFVRKRLTKSKGPHMMQIQNSIKIKTSK
jgi:hypothetical protein